MAATRMTRRLARVLLILGAVCIGVALGLTRTAGAAGAPVTVSVDGGAYAAGTSRPLLDADSLAPGQRTTGTLGVRNGLTMRADLHLRVHDQHDDDNGCGQAEREVDATCGAGEGELGSELQARVQTAARPGQFVTHWRGPFSRLADGLDTALLIDPGETGWVRVVAWLPTTAGQEVASDSYRFTLRAELVGADDGLGIGGAEVGGSGIDGVSAHRPDGHGVPGSLLAGTGIATQMLLIIGGLAAGGGVVLVVGARARRGSRPR